MEMNNVKNVSSLGEEPVYDENDPVDATARNIHTTNLDLDIQQARTYITNFPVTPKDEQLVESIKANGLLEPLIVRPIECVGYEFDTEADYVVVAGSRRLRAAEAAGKKYVNCKVLDLDDEEAYRISLHENLGREDLTDYMTVKHIGGWYRLLAENLVGEDEEVDCPECGKGCSGSRSLQTHLGIEHGGSESFAEPFLSRKEVEEKIATELYGDEGKWRTVRNIVSVASLPKEAMCLIKTEDELEPGDADLLAYYGLTPEKTPNASVGDGVATVLVELARLARTLPGLPGERVVKAYAKYGDDIPTLRKRVVRWKEHEGDDFGLEAFDKALKGQEPPEPEEEEEEGEGEEEKAGGKTIETKAAELVKEMEDEDEGEEEDEEEGGKPDEEQHDEEGEDEAPDEGNEGDEEPEEDEDQAKEEQDEEDEEDEESESDSSGGDEGEDEDEQDDGDDSDTESASSQRTSPSTQESEEEEEEEDKARQQQSPSSVSEPEPFSITLTFHGEQAERMRGFDETKRKSFIDDLHTTAEELLEGY